MSPFLDTGAWIMVLNQRDALHGHALRIWTQLLAARRPLVLTDFIIAETGNGLARTTARAAFVPAVTLMMTSPRARVVRTTDEALNGAMALYADRPDKTWGFIDCVSFNLMRAEGITDAFTTDHHFEQAGFRCLLPTGGR